MVCLLRVKDEDEEEEGATVNGGSKGAVKGKGKAKGKGKGKGKRRMTSPPAGGVGQASNGMGLDVRKMLKVSDTIRVGVNQEDNESAVQVKSLSFPLSLVLFLFNYC